ncbi:MAG TPA: hypothetical protein VIJ62_02150 [Rhizomicrobium sp.]
MCKQIKTQDELRWKVLAALTQEACCEGIRDFDLYRHAHDELGVNWSVKLRDGDPEGKCYEGINAVVAMLAKAYDLAE